MNSDNWYKVDNVAKIFLATHTKRDTRTLCVGCRLDEKIDPDYLEKALHTTIKSRPHFQVRIRRGLFWHYIESTKTLPAVSEKRGRMCPRLYGSSYKGTLHYSVTYYNDRINFEVFHALTDGTGALDFLNILVLNYLKLKYPDSLEGVSIESGGSASEREEDSYARFYDNNGEASPAVKKSYHIRGLKLPYDQLQFLEVKLNSKDVIKKAKEIGVGVSALIGARLMLAISKDMPQLKRKYPVTISMPVNLRNYYPSESSRNFFNSISISHRFTGDETLETLAKEFDVNMKASLEPDAIRRHMDHYQKIEHILFIRMIPLFIKQPILRFFSKQDGKKVSAVISNLGQIKPKEELAKHINGYNAFCSHNELFMTVLSYGEDMVFGITSGYRNTGVLKNFVRSFSKDGIKVSVNASEVIR